MDLHQRRYMVRYHDAEAVLRGTLRNRRICQSASDPPPPSTRDGRKNSLGRLLALDDLLGTSKCTLVQPYVCLSRQ
jgi:hypothetical protein